MENNTLKHHGVKGQRWGVRRYQYQNGELTPAGKERYERLMLKEMRRDIKKDHKEERQAIRKERLLKVVGGALTIIGAIKLNKARNNRSVIDSGEAATNKAMESISRSSMKIDDDTTFYY